ncbi:TPA: hypothetical protein ACF317_004409, partial [Vibrio parahaemolyticus]
KMWHIKWKNRQQSNVTSDVAFLWQETDKPIYIMDNHRCAAWCWAQHISATDKVQIVNVDQHWDGRGGNYPSGYQAFPVMQGKLVDYLNETHAGHPIFLYDTYIDLFCLDNPSNVELVNFVPKPVQITPNPQVSTIRRDAVEFEGFMFPGNSKKVINIDIDFFFYTCPNGGFYPVFSDEYIDVFVGAVAELLNEDEDIILTLCLSPSFCKTSSGNGWSESELILKKFVQKLGLSFVAIP